MSTRSGQISEDFVLQVRDALVHLYDFAHLQRHPLLVLVASPAADAGKALRMLLLQTLEELNPGARVSHNDREWRPYGILARRYVDGFSVEDIMGELGISLRQLQRDHRKGLLAVADLLWRKQDSAGEQATPAPEAGDSDLQQEMERLGVTLERVDLGTLVADIAEPARALAGSCGVRLEMVAPKGAASALADSTLAKQAVLGALSTLITARPARLTLSGRNQAGSAVLELDVEPTLPEQRLPAGRLTAVSELLHMQGGKLETFGSAGSIGTVQLSFRTAAGLRVLLIDDNESLLQLFERYLAGEGFMVSGVTSASRALEALRESKPDVVVMDVMMRQVDGWQLLQQLRADPDLQGVPIVVCSVLNEPEMAQALGAHYYLKKPASQQQLLATLRLALAGNSPAQRRRAER